MACDLRSERTARTRRVRWLAFLLSLKAGAALWASLYFAARPGTPPVNSDQIHTRNLKEE
jgi:hypothetical protein